MIKTLGLASVSALFFLIAQCLFPCTGRSDDPRVLVAIRRVESTFQAVQGYACDVDQIFYQDGSERQRHRFKLYFKRKKKIRVDFLSPYPSLSIFYAGGDREATVMPFRFLTALKFRYSIDSPKIRTLAGQRIDQSDLGFFIEFVLKNLSEVNQGEEDYQEDEEQIRFLLRAKDYVRNQNLETYRITISKTFWLPVRIERRSLDDRPIEITDIRDYRINVHLEDKFFIP